MTDPKDEREAAAEQERIYGFDPDAGAIEERPCDLRFLNGRLQQRWSVVNLTTGAGGLEWRDVPRHEEEDEREAGDTQAPVVTGAMVIVAADAMRDVIGTNVIHNPIFEDMARAALEAAMREAGR